MTTTDRWLIYACFYSSLSLTTADFVHSIRFDINLLYSWSLISLRFVVSFVFRIFSPPSVQIQIFILYTKRERESKVGLSSIVLYNLPSFYVYMVFLSLFFSILFCMIKSIVIYSFYFLSLFWYFVHFSLFLIYFIFL